MKTVCFVLVVALAMEKFCVSAQQYTVSGCKDGMLQLNCRTGLIGIENVVLADSSCSGSRCCPRAGDCNRPPSEAYRNQVHTNCNGRSSCSMHVEIRKIGCSFWGPNNDYANITYRCIAIATTPASTLLTTPSPTTLSSASTSVLQFTTTSTSVAISTTRDYNRATEMGQRFTPSISTPIDTPSYMPDANRSAKMRQQSTSSMSTPIDTPSYMSDANRATELEKKEGDVTSYQWSVKISARLNPTHPLQPGKDMPGFESDKPGKDMRGSEGGKSAALIQTDQDKDYGYLDRVTTLVGVIVGGVVITATVISVAVVFALKKRRIAKSEHTYDMPTYSCNDNRPNDDGNVRNSNIYDFIPDSGNCSAAGDSANVDCTQCTAKENDYLTPVMGCEEEPYFSIP